MLKDYRITTIFGIPIELHWTFILFFVLILVFTDVEGVVFIALLFMFVVGHELAHSIVAIRGGSKISRIILLPIGGIASGDLKGNPRDEFMVAVAGPLFNFASVFIAIALLYYTNPVFFADIAGFAKEGDITNMENTINSASGLTDLLLTIADINFILGGFNLLPAFPMDGGRIFRSLLAMIIIYRRATEVAIRLGQIIFAVMFVVGIYTNLFLSIIALFLFMISPGELRVVDIKEVLGKRKIADIADTNFGYANTNLALSEFVERVMTPKKYFYLVIDDFGGVVGVITPGDISRAKEPQNRKIGEFAKPFETIDSNRIVDEQISKLLSSDFLVVVDGRRVIGFVTPSEIEDVKKYYEVLDNVYHEAR